jgi:hypothetical protein
LGARAPQVGPLVVHRPSLDADADESEQVTREEELESDDTANPGYVPTRRWGWVVPASALGLALVLGGAAMVLAWWFAGGILQLDILLMCVVGGPMLLWFAAEVYRDPRF